MRRRCCQQAVGFPSPATEFGLAVLQSQMERRLVQPASQVLRPADRLRLASQHEKDRLGDILRRSVVMQHAPADAAHHSFMPADEGSKGVLVGRANKTVHQLRLTGLI